MTTTIKGATYEVREIKTGPLTQKDLIARGWDGQTYLLVGNRGATKAAYRNAKTGEFKTI